jgi:hypothetical protein
VAAESGLIRSAVGTYSQNGPNYSPKDLEHLWQIAAHPALCHIPYRVQSRLKDIGYAKEVLGGLVLTDDGLQRIAIDRERVRAFVVEPNASR